MLSNIIAIVCVITTVTAHIQLKPCESKVQSIKVFPSTGETVEWDLQDSFFRGTYLSYSLSPSNTSFKIQKPFAQLSSPQPHVESVNKVAATRALTGKGQRVWMNHFAFINVEIDRIELYYSEGQQGDNLNPPHFSKMINVATNSSFLSCLGVEYASQDLFILDCLDSTKLPFTNKLFVVDKVGNSRIFENSNFNQYSVNTRRISQSIVITNKLQREHTYLLRATPAFATQQKDLDLNSIIEVFYIEQDGTPRLQSVLDAPLLGVLLEVIDLDNFTFSLIDFKAFPNGLIYILTAKQGIYIVELLGNGEFALKDRIFPNLEQAYAFDVDYIIQEDGTLKEVIAILYDDFIQMIENKKSTKKYVLEFVANYPTSIAITQQFLIIQFKGITYLFSTQYEDFIHKETIEGAKGYLINPYAPELIVITSIDSRRITFTHGLLRFPSTNVPLSTLTQVQLIANDTNLAQCKVSINYKVFNSSDYSVQAVDELKIQDLIYDTPQPFYIEPLVSGPNLNFAQQLQDNLEGTTISAKITQIQEMMFNEISFPPSIFIVYSDVLIIDANDERYALLVQTSDKEISIYNCEIHNKFIAKSDCVQYKSYSLNIKLSQSNFLWWHQGLNIYYLTIETDYSAVIRETQLNSTMIIGEFSYSENPLNKISSVTILKDRLFFILGNRKQIDVRSATSPYDIEYSITEETIKNRGFTGNWNPQRIFGNRVHNSYIFFIANEDNVIVADYHTQLTIIKTITLSKGIINLAVGIERFFIILKSSTISLIQEYDLTNLNSIQLVKNLPLYWFTLQTPLQTDFCSHTGVLFVRAYDIQTNQTIILTYSPGKLLRDSLLQVLYLEFFIPDGTSINLSSAGSNQMVVYTNSGKLQKIYSIFLEPVFTLSPNYDQNVYFSTHTLKFQVSNFEDVPPQQYSQVINLVNTQIGVKVDQSFLNRRRLNVTKTDQIYDLSTGWFEGQVVSLEISCEQCNEKIIPIQTVQQIGQGKFAGYQIVDAAPLKGSLTIYLANKLNKRVLITDEDNELITTYSINLSSESGICDHIAASEDGEFIFTTCQVNDKVSVHVAKCTTTGSLECHQFGTVQSIQENKMISQIEVYGNYLFVLDSNPNKPKQYEGQLNIYKWTAETSQITILLAKQFNKIYFGQKSMHFSSFYLTTYKSGQDQYYKILLLESSNILYSLDGLTNHLGEITWLEIYKSLDLYSYINQAGYFVSQQSQFQQIKPIAASQYSSTSDLLTTYTLITTDNSAHYAIQLDFKSYNISAKSIIYILNQYSTLPSLNKVAIGNGYAIIPYLDNNEILLASYALPSFQVSASLVKFVGGITAQFLYSQVQEFVVYIPNNIELPRLYSNIISDPESNENLLKTYDLNNNFQIQVLNSDGTVYDQFVLLTLINSFNQDSGLVYLKIAKQQEERIWDQIINFIW